MYDVVVKMFTFAVSSPDDFLFLLPTPICQYSCLMAQLTWFRPRTVLLGLRQWVVFWGEMCPQPPSPQKRGFFKAFSSQSRKILKLAYCQNSCIDSNQILHSDKDHQTLVMGSPITRTTNLLFSHLTYLVLLHYLAKQETQKLWIFT